MAYELSILIPSRNEEFLARTVEAILKAKQGKTEILVGLDGQWANPGIEDHPDVKIIYVSESIGQRAMTNRLAALSQAKYVMKVDAHCAFDKGFDVKMVKMMQGHDDWTVVPLMKNLHAFDWKCMDCGHKVFQSPVPKVCEKCGSANLTKKLVWRPNPQRVDNTSYRFDRTLHFQYYGAFKHRSEGKGPISPTLSLQGSCFMLTRERYFALDICDEKAGSWGHQGSEVALKSWLSGGKVMVNHQTWYAHMFRTNSTFTFPYQISGNDQERARAYIRDIFLNDKWPLAVRTLRSLIQQFAPVPDWEDVPISNITEVSKSIIYYTDNQLNLKIATAVQKRLKSIGLPIVSCSLKPMDNMGKNIHLPLERGSLTMFKQILAALEATSEGIVFFCEADVLYHPSHFDFTPPRNDLFYYNQAVWRWKYPTDKAVTWEANQVAELCCYRDHAIKWYKNKIHQIETVGFDRSYEPGGRDKTQYATWWSKYPNIDIRHDSNFTKSKWSQDDFRDKSTCVNWQESTIDKIPGWEELPKLLR